MNRRVATLLVLMLAATLAASLAAAVERPRIQAVDEPGRPSILEPPAVKQAGERVLDIFLTSTTWERVKVRRSDTAQADKARLRVTAPRDEFRVRRIAGGEPTFTVTRAESFDVLGPVTATAASPDRPPIYKFQLRFEGHRPREEIERADRKPPRKKPRSLNDDARDGDDRRRDDRRDDRGGRPPRGPQRTYDAQLKPDGRIWLLFLTEPGAADWTEEWILTP